MNNRYLALCEQQLTSFRNHWHFFCVRLCCMRGKMNVNGFFYQSATRVKVCHASNEITSHPDGRDLNEGYLSGNEPQIIISWLCVHVSWWIPGKASVVREECIRQVLYVPSILSEGHFISTGNFGSRGGWVQWSQLDKKQLINKLRRVTRFTSFLLLNDPEPDPSYAEVVGQPL